MTVSNILKTLKQTMVEVDTVKIYFASTVGFLSNYLVFSDVIKGLLSVTTLVYTMVKTYALIRQTFKKDKDSDGN